MNVRRRGRVRKEEVSEQASREREREREFTVSHGVQADDR